MLRGYALNRCRTCFQYYPEYYDRCPYGCVVTTVSFQSYGVDVQPSEYTLSNYMKDEYDRLVKELQSAFYKNSSKEMEKDMCEKKEPVIKWGLRIGTDSRNQYSVDLNKKIVDENSGYVHSHDNLLRTFETFEEALKFTNDTHKNLSK